MPTTLYDAIQTIFPVKTASKVNSYDVDTSSPPTELCKNNPNRLGLVISNVGDYPVYISFEKDVAASEGLLLNANGGFVGFQWNEDFDITGWGWHGIASGAASKVSVFEILSV